MSSELRIMWTKLLVETQYTSQIAKFRKANYRLIHTGPQDSHC
jgi:hypothetical protein